MRWAPVQAVIGSYRRSRRALGRPRAGLALTGGLLGAALGWACAPDPELQVCTDEVVGQPEDWQPATVPAEVAACAPAPPERLGLCVAHDQGANALGMDVEISGVIVEVGSGEPPSDCFGPEAIGLRDVQGVLVHPVADVRWIRIDADGEEWVITLAAPGNTTTLAVGDQVEAWVQWDRRAFFTHYHFELRDEHGQTLWWFAADDGGPLEHTPECLPMRLGAPQCIGDSPCATLQHHAIEIADVTVAPGQQAVIDGLRFTHGASWFGYEPTCTDYTQSWRMLAATREG